MKTAKYIKEINKFREKLTQKNQEKFDKILLKLRYSNLRSRDAEEFSHHCLDLFLSAQEENISIEQVLGNDSLEVFCNEFIFETRANYSILEKIYLRIQYLPLIFLIFTGFFEMTIGYLIKEWINANFVVKVPFTTSMLLNILVVMIFTNLFVNRMPYFYDVLSSDDIKKDKTFTYLLFGVIVLMTIFFILSKFYLRTVLFKINFIIFVGIVGLICLIQNLTDF